MTVSHSRPRFRTANSAGWRSPAPLATNPKLLLLDEPAAGMNEQETEELLHMVRELRDLGYTILLIEHDMKFVMNVCERIYVLNYGELLAEGTPLRCAIIRW